MNITTVQLLLRFTSLHQTGNDLQEDPTTRGSEPLNRIWDLWTPVLPIRGRRQPLENTGVRLWTRLRLRRTVCYEEEKKKTAICYSAVQATWPWVCLFVYLPISVYLCPCLSVTSRSSVETSGRIELVFGIQASFDLSSVTKELRYTHKNNNTFLCNFGRKSLAK